MGKFIDRTGERFKNKEDLGGYEFVIIEYNNNKDVWVEFQDKYRARVHTIYEWCKKGRIKNPYHPNTYGGYIGQGKYKSKDEQGNLTKCYEDWYNLLKRIGNKVNNSRSLAYEDAILVEEWYNFQNYAEWWYANKYDVEGETMCVDKDILNKGNKIYSPDTCIFVPERINMLFINTLKKGRKYPIGVHYMKANGKYVAQCSIMCNGEQKGIYLGLYNTPKEAFLVYKEFKEAYIKDVADEYKDKIPQRLYNAMYNWEVEITD